MLLSSSWKSFLPAPSEEDPSVRARDGDFHSRRGERDVFVACLQRPLRSRPASFRHDVQGRIRKSGSGRVNDVNNRVRANLHAKHSGFHREKRTIGLLRDAYYRIERSPLRAGLARRRDYGSDGHERCQKNRAGS
jgi:hypothetical protein